MSAFNSSKWVAGEMVKRGLTPAAVVEPSGAEDGFVDFMGCHIQVPDASQDYGLSVVVVNADGSMRFEEDSTFSLDAVAATVKRITAG